MQLPCIGPSDSVHLGLFNPICKMDVVILDINLIAEHITLNNAIETMKK